LHKEVRGILASLKDVIHMNDETQYLTQEKFDEFKEELQYLSTTRRKKIAESLEYARSLGDLSENAEYAEARDLQAATEERIRHLESILASAKILKRKKSEEVTLGTKVVIAKQGEKDNHDYTIVGSEETNMLERKLSYLSPLGEALMGKKKGDTFTFETPSGKQKYTIISVE
jgi:transcription elongation factor GreA